MKALPDIRTANKVVELVLKNASIAVTGIWQAEDDGVLNPATVRLVPGSIIPKAPGSAGLTPLAAPGNFDVSQLVLNDLRARIRGALLADRLGPPQDAQMTATEVLERGAQTARLLGATYGRLQAELLTPLVTRCLGILRRRGEIPPLLLDGREAALRYESPLARVQGRADAANTLLFLQSVGALGGVAAAQVDAAAATRWLARTLGAPAEVLVPLHLQPGASPEWPRTCCKPRRRRPPRTRRPGRARCRRSSGTPRPARCAWTRCSSPTASWSAACRSAPRRPPPDAAPEDLLRFRQAMGIPETPDAYSIAAPHELCCADAEVNQRLHAAHFTNDQAQLVYDLAAERLLPLIAEAAAQFEADRQRERLSAHFGGEDRFRQVAAQLSAWGRAKLPAPVYEALSSTAEGVLALEQMMRKDEPVLVARRRPARARERGRAARDDARPALLAPARAGIRPPRHRGLPPPGGHGG